MMWLILLSAISFCAAIGFRKPLSLARADYIAPPLIVQRLTSGFSYQASDSFWLRAVQDFDFCSEKVNERECKGKSWLFQMVNLTTELDKKFHEAYLYGGMALTVIISDYAGASVIFDKGIENFESDAGLNMVAAYHALYEEKNKAKASKLYLTAANSGAPPWMRVLAGKLAAESGEMEFANLILQQMIASSEDPKLVERLKEKLRDLKKSQ